MMTLYFISLLGVQLQGVALAKSLSVNISSGEVLFLGFPECQSCLIIRGLCLAHTVLPRYHSAWLGGEAGVSLTLEFMRT